ncbi:hypothetical protein MF1_11140 [Bartonella quintana]|nr:hypothetical protein MF1_11140 [Bartonella quintana]
MGGNMVRKKTEKTTELTEAEKEMLQEMILTYQSIKVMSRCIKWLVFIIFLFVVDLARLIDAIENIFAHLKQWILKK